MTQSDFQKNMSQLETLLDKYLREMAPALPKNWKEFLVEIVPYLAIIGVVIGIPAVLTLLGLSTVGLPFFMIGGAMTGRPFKGVSYLIANLFLIVTLVLEALAILPLFKREKKGWRYLYYAALVGGLSSLIRFDLIGLIIGTGLSLYLLFQIKEYYK